MRFPVIPTIFLSLLFITGAVIGPNIVHILPEKQALVARLNAQSGLQLAVAGDVRLRFLPRPQVILNKVTISSKVETAQKLRAEKIVINLSPLDLLQERISVQGIYLLRADGELVLDDGIGGLIERLAEITHPGIRFIDSTFSLRGLSAHDATRTAMVAHIGLDLPARGPRDDLQIVLRQTRPGHSETVFRGRLGNLDARRQDLSVSLQFAANERISFDGFLRQSGPDWRADGEMRVDSEAMISGLAQAHLPVGLSQPARRIAFSGLVQFDGTGARSENLEITALDTVFQSRLTLDWPQAAGDMPLLTGRLSTGVLNLDNLSPALATNDDATSSISAVWQAFEQKLDIALRVEATRFDVGGESGQNLLLTFDWQGDSINVQRFSLNLPFRSLLLANGLLDVGENGPSFNGSFSTRSTDALAAVLWLGTLVDSDNSGLIETLDESRLQRVSLVGDMVWSPQVFELLAVSGRLGDDRVAADMSLALTDSWRGQVDVQMERLDLADWGATGTTTDSNQSVMTALLAPLNENMGLLLSNADTQRDLQLSISAETLFSGVSNLGGVAFAAHITDQTLHLQNLTLSDYQGLVMEITGRLQFDAASPYGKLSSQISGTGSLLPTLATLFPFAVPEASPVTYRAEWRLTAPDAPDWPNTTLQGEGKFGDIETTFISQGPAREISFDGAGQRLELTMQGKADNIARLVNMAPIYGGSTEGALRLEMDNQSSNLSQITGELALDKDRLSLSGSMRRGASGRRVEGALSYDLADVLPLFTPVDGRAPVPLKGSAQIASDADSLAFSSLDATIGAGQVTGEGVVDFTADLPKLTANIKADNVNISGLLPDYLDDGWSDNDMQWPVFTRADLDVELSGTNITLGHLELEELIGRVKLLDGVMEVPQITGRALDGGFAGSLLAEGGSLTPYFNLDLRLTEIDASGLMTELFSKSPLRTRLGGTLNLSGRGPSPRAMMASLNGGMQFDLAAGQLLFIDMAAFQAAIQAADLADAAAPLVQSVTDETASRFTRGVGLIEVQNGRANRANLDFVFAPSISPRDGRLDAKFDFVSGDVLGDFTLYPTQSNKKLVWDLSGTLGSPEIVMNAGDFEPVPQENAPSAAAPN